MAIVEGLTEIEDVNLFKFVHCMRISLRVLELMMIFVDERNV